MKASRMFSVSPRLYFSANRDVAAVRNLSISCCDQLLNVLVILHHSGGLLLINQSIGNLAMFAAILRASL